MSAILKTGISCRRSHERTLEDLARSEVTKGLAEYIMPCIALKKLDSYARELWPDIKWSLMEQLVVACLVWRAEPSRSTTIDVTALAAFLNLDRSKCSRMITEWEKLGYIKKHKLGNSTFVIGTKMFHAKSKIYLDLVAELLGK